MQAKAGAWHIQLGRALVWVHQSIDDIHSTNHTRAIDDVPATRVVLHTTDEAHDIVDNLNWPKAFSDELL